MTEHVLDIASSPTVSRAGDHLHLVHTGNRPPQWLTELAGRLSPVRPGEAVVMVGAPLHEDGVEALCEWLAPSLDSVRDAHVRLLTLVMSAGAHGAGGRPSAARTICERWGLDVLAPAGTALVTSDGGLFSPDLPGASGGWWHFSPGADARRVSSHLPVPDWEMAVRRVGRQTVAGHVVESVPAGLAVRPAGPAPVTAHTRPHGIPPERDRPQLILSSPQVRHRRLLPVAGARRRSSRRRPRRRTREAVRRRSPTDAGAVARPGPPPTRRPRPRCAGWRAGPRRRSRRPGARWGGRRRRHRRGRAGRRPRVRRTTQPGKSSDGGAEAQELAYRLGEGLAGQADLTGQPAPSPASAALPAHQPAPQQPHQQQEFGQREDHGTGTRVPGEGERPVGLRHPCPGFHRTHLMDVHENPSICRRPENVECGKAAAQASQTRLVHKFHSGTWNLLANKAGAELLNDNMRQIGAPRFTDADHALAKAVQKSLKPEVGMPTELAPLAPPAAAYTGGLATDTADISWQAPTAVLLSAAYPPGIPNHNWGATATAATNIGHQALLSAARYLAAGAIDLIEQPALLDAMKQEFADRTEGIEWASMIPDGNQPPLYEPPTEFLKATGRSWPPKGVTWPVPPIVSNEQLGGTGPALAPVT